MADLRQQQSRQGPAAQAPAQGRSEQPPKPEKTEQDQGQSGQPKPESKPKRPYRVASRIFVDGSARETGEILDLTQEQAASLGEAVSTNTATPEPENIQARSAGLYEVAGPGTVWFSGKSQQPGAVLELNAQDARDLGLAVKRVA